MEPTPAPPRSALILWLRRFARLWGLALFLLFVVVVFRAVILPFVLGVLVATASRAGADVSARRKAAAVDRRLRNAIGSVGDEMVIGPIAAEIDAYCRCRDGVAAALKK